MSKWLKDNELCGLWKYDVNAKKYKKKFIESFIFHELCMFKVEKVSIFSKKFIIINVLRATSEQKLVTLFLIKNVNYRNESKNTLAFNIY